MANHGPSTRQDYQDPNFLHSDKAQRAFVMPEDPDPPSMRALVVALALAMDDVGEDIALTIEDDSAYAIHVVPTNDDNWTVRVEPR